jgi:hypothetical protein
MTAPQTVTANFGTYGTSAPSATFVPLDTTTQGTWTGHYGADGYIIANDANSPPPYSTVSMTGDAAWTWANPTSDVRALQTASGASTRIASTFYSTGGSFNININLIDGNPHRVALYLLDWDSTTRAETISILNSATNAVLDTESFSSFQNGEYAIWNLTGNVIIQVTRTGGINAAVAGIFFDTPAVTTQPPVISAVTASSITSTSAVITWTTDQATTSLVKYGTTTGYGSSSAENSTLTTSHSVALTGLTPGTAYNYDVVSANSGGTSSTSANFTFATLSSTVSSGATYLTLDTTTQGTWTGAYGGDGFIIANSANSAPTYASVGFTGQSTWTWAIPTSDPRALQTFSGSSTRIASTYYGGSSFSINVNLSDGNAHKIALYLLDWDSGSRAETISILDAGTHAVLSTQSFSGFQNGQYASWSVKGNVIIQVTLTGGENPVVAGIFFGGSVAATGPVITGVTATNIIDTSATIVWTTDQPSSSQVNYGTTTGYGTSSALNGTLVTSHSVTLSGLTPGTAYDYEVVSANSTGASTTSSNFTFTTEILVTGPGPVISPPPSISVTATTASFTWTTDQPSSTVVLYGPTTSYGSSSSNPAFVTSHAVQLTGLTPATTYYCEIISTNSAGTSSTYTNCTFTTLSSSGSSASYVGLDTTTQGTWTPSYGADGFVIPNDETSITSYATVNVTGASTWTWATGTSDVRALQIYSGATARIASTYYAPSTFSINVNITDGNTHKIALYLLDWDSGSRAETISILDASSHAVLNTQSFSNFQNGQFASWDISGSVIFQVTLTGGENAVVAGIFFGGAVPIGPVITSVTATNITGTSATITWTTSEPSTSQVNYGTTTGYGSSSILNATLVTSHSVTLSGLTPGVTYDYDAVSANASNTSSTSANFTFATPASSTTSSAAYQGLDTTTQGTWTGHYGSNGYLIASDANTLPAFAATSLTGDAVWTFASTTSDARAPQISSGSSSRIAAVFYSTGGSFSINLNLTDGKSHRIALYLLDWDTTSRAETITIMDAASHAVLSTESFSSFQNGEYASWNTTGNVIIQVTDTAGINAVVSGIFVD